ncbi:MAG TPA: hypothetical protein PKD37_04435 [Oligoflexia bacterium]|nr:hypothetical protein [Oligoflexia bacterium]HMP27213.1 hypothetical protein [Oligoflexia bacterium]
MRFLFWTLIIFFFAYGFSALPISKHAYVDPTPLSPLARPLTDTITNSYFTWQECPAIRFLAKWSRSAASRLNLKTTEQEVFSASAMLIFILGTLLLIRIGSASLYKLQPHPLGLSVVSSIAIGIAVTSITRFDKVALQATAWLPLVTAFLLVNKNSSYRSPTFLILLIYFLYRLFVAAGFFSPLVAIAVFFLVFLIYPQKNSQELKLLISLVAISTIYVLLSLNLPSLPDYPNFARVVPDDGLPGNITPLITANPIVQIVDRSAEIMIAKYSLIALLPVTLALLLSIIRGYATFNQKNFSPKIIILFLAMIGIVLWDLTPEVLASQGPLQAIKRILPGGMFISIINIYLALLVSIYGIWGSLIGFKFFTLISLGLSILLSIFNPYYQSVTHIQNFDQNNMIVNSPSYYLIKQLGENVISAKELLPKIKPARVRDTMLTTYSHLGDIDYAPLVDGRNKSRILLSSGGQKGDEWLQMRFHLPVSAYGIQLNISKFPGDFPRGIQVYYKKRCQRLEKPKIVFGKNLTAPLIKEYQKLIDIDNWQGEVKYTQIGFPYFGSQNIVNLYFLNNFPNPTKFQCLLIKQTGKDSFFEWSIGELKLLQTGIADNEQSED